MVPPGDTPQERYGYAYSNTSDYGGSYRWTETENNKASCCPHCALHPCLVYEIIISGERYNAASSSDAPRYCYKVSRSISDPFCPSCYTSFNANIRRKE